MTTTLSIILIVFSVLLVISVLLQQTGNGLSGTFGGGGSFYQTRRGLEKVLFKATILAGIAIVIANIAYLVTS